MENLDNYSDFDNEQNLDLTKVFKIILRNKKTIFFFTLSSLILSIFYMVFKKPIWEGEFQIVIANKQNSLKDRVKAAGADLDFLIGSTPNQGVNLRTQEQILKSPSLLMPIFNFVKEEKIKLDPKNKNLNYRNWSKSIDIELIKKTSVVNISYKDKDKNLIIPVINRISSNFQDYSTRDQIENLNKSIEYLDNQILLAKNRTFKVNQKLDDFSDKYNIRIQQLITDEDDAEGSYSSSFKSDIEIEREKALKNIKSIEFALSQLRKKDMSFSNLSNFTTEAENELLSTIRNVNFKLIDLKSKFKQNDEEIIKAEAKKNQMKLALLERIESRLNYQLKAFNSIVNANYRDPEVLSEFDRLVRSVTREEITLNRLENQRLIKFLERARNETPWELITKPTLIDEVVSPKKTRVLFIGFIFGILFGFVYSALLENKKKIIFELDYFKTLIDYKLLLVLKNEKKSNYWRDSLNLMLKGPLGKIISNKSVAFIPITSLIPPCVNDFEKLLNDTSEKPNFKITSNLMEAFEYDQQILLAYPGLCSLDEFNRIIQDLKLQGKKIIGWIYFSD